MDYDKINEKLGEFGKYHKFVYFLVCFPPILVALNMLSYVFVSANPKHRCFIDGCDNKTSPFQDYWLNLTIPKLKNGHYDQCLRFSPMEIHLNESSCPAEFNKTRSINCHRWKYDTSDYGTTTVTDWDLVCSRGWLAPLSGSLWMFGVIIGAAVFGVVSDRYGRRNTLLLAILICAITGIIVPFSVNFEMFLSVRLIQAASTTGIYQTAFVLGLEVVGPSQRVLCGIGISLAFAVGEILLGVLADFVRDWRTLEFYLALPTFLLLSYYWLLPESARWLISQGRYPEAKAVIKKIAVINKVSVPLDLLECEDDNFDPPSISKSSNSSSSVSALDLFRTPRLRWRTLNIFLNWFMNTIGYYGISMNATNLRGDIYLDFILTSAIEIPALIFCLFVLNRIGRKKPLIYCMIIGGLSCVSTIFVPQTPEYQWVAIMLSLIGKFGCSAAFSIIYVFSIELFPTVLRNNGIGLSSFFAHIGGILAPYIASLSEFGRSIPLVIFGSSSLIAGLFAIFLPETLHQKLPETVEDAESFGRKQRMDVKHSKEESEQLLITHRL